MAQPAPTPTPQFSTLSLPAMAARALTVVPLDHNSVASSAVALPAPATALSTQSTLPPQGMVSPTSTPPISPLTQGVLTPPAMASPAPVSAAPAPIALSPPFLAAPVPSPRHDDIPIPKMINYIWLGQTFHNFNKAQIINCAKKNKDHTIQLWIDDFSMVDLEDGLHGMSFLSRILDRYTYHSYRDAMGRIVRPEVMQKYMELLVSAQRQWLLHIQHNAMAKGSTDTAIAFWTFVVRAQLDHDVDIKIRYLSTDFYGPLLATEAQDRLRHGDLDNQTLRACGQEKKGPEMRLLEWAFYERFRKNYAAASNLLRVQPLKTHPGIYLDHDDTAPVFGDLTGFKYARSANYYPNNAFLASSDGHPFLQHFRDQILQRYTALHADRNKFFDYVKPNKPTDADDLDHPFITHTDYIAGPGAFAEAVKDVRAGALGESMDIRKAWLKAVRINPTTRKTWALKDS